MFDFLKNKALGVVMDELDPCLSFVLEDRSKSGAEVNQILNTIRHFIGEILEGKLSEQQAQNYFMQMKTDIAFRKNLSNYRDMDYAKAYILNAFFTCVTSNRLAEAKKTGIKILDYCAKNCSSDAKPAAVGLRDDLIKIFN